MLQKNQEAERCTPTVLFGTHLHFTKDPYGKVTDDINILEAKIIIIVS